MRLWIYGFFMAWGMFLAIPCPFPKWDEKARSRMMVCLPLVGGIVGGLWALAAWLLRGASLPLRAAVLAMVPWLCTGFLHLDGYMDVCDAILSRRDLETRQKILKDSHCGAFAVICMVLLALGQWSIALSAEKICYGALALVPVATRACASIAVQTLPRLTTSQYAKMKCDVAAVTAVSLMLAATVIAPVLLWGLAGLAPLAAAAGYWLAALHGFRDLHGMSGDISGFALTLGELAGLAVICLVR